MDVLRSIFEAIRNFFLSLFSTIQPSTPEMISSTPSSKQEEDNEEDNRREKKEKERKEQQQQQQQKQKQEREKEKEREKEREREIAREKEKKEKESLQKQTKEETPKREFKLDPNIIVEEVFENILMCDEDESHSFSKTLVFEYFEQVRTTIPKLLEEYEKRELEPLSKTAHFLKSSSLTTGAKKLGESLKQIEFFATKKDLNKNAITEEEALRLIPPILNRLEDEFQEVKTHLLQFYQ